MRKFFSILLISAVLISLTGCMARQEEILFYYPRVEILYGEHDGVITSEVRSVSGKEDDLQYLLLLYLEGPISKELTSPFPEGTEILELTVQENELTVVLSDPFSHLEGMDYTIACACIAQTCFSLRDLETVEISSGNFSTVLDRNTIALADNSAATDPQ